MLRKSIYLKNYTPPQEDDKAVCFYADNHVESIIVNGKQVNHICKCHHQLEEQTDFDSNADDYKLEILIEAGVSLKPSPLMQSTSLDELSFINNTLNNEIYETPNQNSEQ